MVLQSGKEAILSLSIVTGSIPGRDECALSSADQDEVTGPYSDAEGRVHCQKPDTNEEKEHVQTEVKIYVSSTVFFVTFSLCSILIACAQTFTVHFHAEKVTFHSA